MRANKKKHGGHFGIFGGWHQFGTELLEIPMVCIDDYADEKLNYNCKLNRIYFVELS